MLHDTTCGMCHFTQYLSDNFTKGETMRYFLILNSILALCVCACEQATPDDLQSNDILRLQKTTIVNGQAVTGDDHMNVVTLAAFIGGNYYSTCTGTLISPNAVITAGHCVDSNANPYLNQLVIGFGQRQSKLQAYEIDKIIQHPDYYFDSDKVGSTIRNDIAIIKLKESVTASEVPPVRVMLPALDVTNDDIMSAEGVVLNAVGFGVRDPSDLSSSGVKYETETKITHRCSKSDCSGDHNLLPGFFYTDNSKTGVCHGDSGGPAFITLDGIQYIIGVASYVTSMQCNKVGAYSIVSDYYDFIAQNVDNMGAKDPEICDNGIDDNGDNKTDCNDPWCFAVKACIPEDCRNKKDDNEDGLTDCEDPKCAVTLVCQPEICDDGIDNNDNDYIDCSDPQCKDNIVCQPEICDDGIDNNSNQKVDCDDIQCARDLVCQPEICDDGVDNNGNDKADCDDPQCEQSSICLPEICDNGIDDNGDNRIDCNDPKCRKAQVCQPEICSDGVDNNGDNKADCDDPQCADNIVCQPEICNDGIDNNGNDQIDCADSQCAGHDACVSSDPSDDCSAAPLQRSGTNTGILAILGLLGLAVKRRISKGNHA